jgi:hypothetical protein
MNKTACDLNFSKVKGRSVPEYFVYKDPYTLPSKTICPKFDKHHSPSPKKSPKKRANKSPSSENGENNLSGNAMRQDSQISKISEQQLSQDLNSSFKTLGRVKASSDRKSQYVSIQMILL